MSLGMIGYGIQNILTRVFFAKKDGKTPLITGVASIAVNIVLCILLVEPMGVSGLALSSAVASTINAAVLMLALKFKGEDYHTRKYMTDIIKMTVSLVNT